MTSTIEGRLVHQHTHTAAYQHHYSSSSSRSSSNSNTETEDPDEDNQLMATTSGLRYSLTQGKQGMTAAMQKASLSSVALALRRNSSNSNSANKSGTKRDPAMSSSPPVSPKSPSSRRSSSSAGTATSPAQANVEMTKIFVLLLEPKTKTFELIQLVYPSATTTIGDILRMIPQHATELALGSQKYVGLCRPKEEQELSDLKMLASSANNTSSNSNNTANVCPGEILVAIPQNYSVTEVSKFSQAILTNRRFTKLLRRNNPLAPKLRKHSDRKKDRKHSNSSKRHSSSSNSKHRSVHILEKHEEEGDDDQMMQRALEKAASAAAQANANIPTSPTTSPRNASNNNDYNYNVKDDSMPTGTRTAGPRKSLAEHFGHTDEDDSSYAHSYTSSSWVDGGGSIYSTSTAGDSLGESISSWSKSLDKSFSKTGGRPQYARHRSSGAASISSSVSQSNNSVMMRQRRPNGKRKGNILWAGAASVLLLAYLMVSYLTDPDRHVQEPIHRLELVKNSPMGLPGLLQVVFLLAVLKKIQFLFNRRQRKIQGTLIPKPLHQSACPAIKLYSKYWNKKKRS